MTKTELHIGSRFADTKRRVLAAVAAATDGPVIAQSHITFESWQALASTLTPRRFDILQRVRQNPAASVAALARDLKRDYKRVHEDVEALAGSGLLDRTNGAIHATYDEIHAVILL